MAASKRIEKSIPLRFSQNLRKLADIALVAMMFLVTGNVILRVFGHPIWGSFEIVGFLGTIVISFALIQTTVEGSHLAVEMIVSRLPMSFRKILDIVNHFLSLAVLAVITWQMLAYGKKVLRTGEFSPTLEIPLYPFLYGIAAAFGVASLIAFSDLVKGLMKRKTQ
jgi:TRAP-type C4-dicarboxylate transport system permease small subunit